MIDARGMRVQSGDLVICVHEDKLYNGHVTKTYPDTGALDVTIYSTTFAEPIKKHVLFPGTQLIAVFGRSALLADAADVVMAQV